MASKQTPRKQAYDKAYNARPDQKANRAARGRARYAKEKALGKKLPSNVDVHHKHQLSKGGSNHPDNTAVTTQKKNRGWRKGLKGYG